MSRGLVPAQPDEPALRGIMQPEVGNIAHRTNAIPSVNIHTAGDNRQHVKIACYRLAELGLAVAPSAMNTVGKPSIEGTEASGDSGAMHTLSASAFFHTSLKRHSAR